MPNLDLIPRALSTLPALRGNIHRYFALNAKPPYAVWAEDGEDAHRADNRTAEQAALGSVDLFTLTEDDPLARAISQALEDADASCRLNSVQHEEETGYIHYEWRWVVN